MTTVTLKPNGDGTRSNWEDEVGGTSNLYQHVDAGTGSPNDSDYIEAVSNVNSFFLLLDDVPGDFDIATACNAVLRALGSGLTITAQIFQSDETTALTNSQVTGTLGGSFSNETLTFTITGATTAAAWNGARIKISSSARDAQVSEIDVPVGYTPTNPPYIVAAPGSLSLTGNPASLKKSWKLACDSGSLSMTGAAASLLKAGKISAAAGSLSLTGQAAAFIRSYILTAAAGSMSLTGQAAALATTTFRLACDAGALALTGNDASLLATRKLSADSGTMTLAGSDAVLMPAWKLTAETGALALIGTDAGGYIGKGMPAETGSLALTGQAAGLRKSWKISCAAGSMSLHGSPAAFPPRQYVLFAQTGHLGLTGSSVTPLNTLKAETAAMSLVGNPANLIYTPAGSGRRLSSFQSRILKSQLMS